MAKKISKEERERREEEKAKKTFRRLIIALAVIAVRIMVIGVLS